KKKGNQLISLIFTLSLLFPNNVKLAIFFSVRN
ncbi:hypothetical protein BVZ73_00364B, partial [Haemophilus influenzae]